MKKLKVELRIIKCRYSACQELVGRYKHGNTWGVALNFHLRTEKF